MIGEITSAIPSPRRGHPLALAILKIGLLTPGTLVDVLYEKVTYPGEVLTLPLS